MKRFLSLALCASLFVSAGCGGPDPRENPNFNEASLKNPGAIKMEPLKKPKGVR